jgi:H+/Cl- antiporter ClcA
MTPTAAEQREFWKQKFLEGKWRWAAFLAIYFASGVSGLFLPRLFGAPTAHPGSDPPWYFIRQDFFQGVGHFLGMFAMLLISVFTWRRYTFTNWFLLMMVAIWMVPGIVTGIVIYWRCTDFFHYGRAASAWPTFAEYSRSGVKFVGIPVGFGLALVCALPMAWRRFRGRHDVA